jgi:thioredoxin reductase
MLSAVSDKLKLEKSQMINNFDLIVIGTGAAGSTVAHKCRSAGWKVAIVDSRLYGGTCALRGCDPKKVLVGAAEVVDWNQRMQGHGLPSGSVQIDWPALMRFKNTFTDPVPDRREEGFRQAGIATFHGRARFLDQSRLQVGDEILSARHFVLAAGSKPLTLDIPGEEHFTTSAQFLDLAQLPQRILFVGGGYISFEFAHVAARAGSRVQILQRSARPLKRFDPDLVNLLVQATQWAKLKETLFQFGVQPISTPEMPSNFIKFEHRETVFNVIDGEVDDICHRNSMLAQRGLIPFAHNFLVHELDGHQVYDPRQSLQQVDEDGRFVIQLLREPRNPLLAFDYMLGSRFECGLLNLKPSAELAELGDYILQSRVAESEAKFITERFLNYFPDLVEIYGYGEVRSILVSPLVRQAVKQSLKVDPDQLDEKLQSIESNGGVIRDYTVLAEINEALGYKPAESDFTKNIDHYMLANAFQVRRVDLMKHLV